MVQTISCEVVVETNQNITIDLDTKLTHEVFFKSSSSEYFNDIDNYMKENHLASHKKNWGDKVIKYIVIGGFLFMGLSLLFSLL